MNTIHETGYLHNDLRTENILVLNKYFQLKVSDFGYAHQIENSSEAWTCLEYLAPECLTGEKTVKSDIFALGVCLFAMATKRYPFKASHVSDPKYSCIIKGDWPKFWKLHSKTKISPLLQNLLSQLLQADPSERPTWQSIIMHPWMQNEYVQIATPGQAREYFAKLFAQYGISNQTLKDPKLSQHNLILMEDSTDEEEIEESEEEKSFLSDYYEEGDYWY
eukprot:TRINITY_DN9392_c0_g1_i1.p1 TRINITY_DN9392_c0_g1~~TRINITY_DN9392_c0_g1_i1.p1  ORF type:complete len:220 (+),score=23.31 TRINITY_DN9392_c0_g1_i1:399-1058(+)